MIYLNTVNFNGIRKNELCDDLLIEILNRSPIKPLFRFKCVSKKWNHLISLVLRDRRVPMSDLFYQTDDSEFIWGDRFSKFTIYDKNFEDILFDFRFLPFYPELRILDVCNGLVLLSDKSNGVYHICNPVLKQWLALPSIQHFDYRIHALVYEPRDSPHYKVFCFPYLSTLSRWDVDIFSSETGEWVDSRVPFQSKVEFAGGRRIVFLNGALHFFIVDHVLIIDVKELQFNIIKLPEDYNLDTVLEYPFFECLGECRGRLCFAYRSYSEDDGYQVQLHSQIRIWVLDDYHHTKWTLMHSTTVEALQKEFSEKIWLLTFLIFHPEEEVMFFRINYRIVSYRISTGRFERAGRVNGKKHGYKPYFRAFPFSCSLYSLEPHINMIQSTSLHSRKDVKCANFVPSL